MNSWGDRFRLSIWGESHGQQVGVSIDGVPAGIALSEEDFTADLERRRAGAAGTTPRKESDTPHIVSGVYNGFTTGSPLTIEFLNENTRSGDYRNLTIHPRPSHADWVAQQKWGGYNDPRGGGHFSGRITLGMVAAGVVAKKILGEEVKFSTDIIEIGGSRDKEQWDAIISSAQQSQDSVGGVVECRVQGVKAGLGEPFFDSVESLAAHLLFSVPAVKGVEFGAGFEAARMRGSEHNDPIISADGTTATNHAGGIVGGITNGNEIVARIAIKPTASIAQPQQTLNLESGKVEELVIKGRHDVCITLRAAVVAEAALAIALADLKLRA
ncbi:MAG: chorismate synthase [Alistipes sp.]|nr:chorismate synthase [Alistipes sp.]